MVNAWTETPEGLRIRLRIQPGASRESIDGQAVLDDRTKVLKIRVCAPPEDGKANAALIRLLARTWKLPKSAFRIIAGAGSRQKTLSIEGDPGDLRRRIETSLERS